MKIGIIGTGNMGRALGSGWARAGHEVLFGSRDRSKAEAIAAQSGSNAQAGTFDEAAAFGEVILYTVRGIFPSRLLDHPEALVGKIVIDCNNSDLTDDLRFAIPIPSLAERLAEDIPQARIVKAFNTIPGQILELDQDTLAPHRVSVFLCADHPAAKTIVREITEELGFVAVDSGPLVRSQLVESLADFLRFQIAGMGLGPYATLSLHMIPRGESK